MHIFDSCNMDTESGANTLIVNDRCFRGNYDTLKIG